VLEPATGRLHYANAGHDLPYVYTEGGTVELRARGVPLGLMPGSTYEEKEAFVQPGQNILFYSDGVVEAHSPEHEMFGFGRVKHIVARHPGSQALIEALLAELARFTGADWEQEDDVTLLVLARDAEQVIAEFTIPSEPGNERLAIARVEDGLRDLPLSPRRMECMKTAVAEATMNAIEHGNKSLPELPVTIKVVVSNGDLHVRITDTGRGGPIPESTPQPDLQAKLRGLQSPRGWGEFLMKRMVDDMHVTWADGHNTIELIVHLDERAAAPAGGPD
jgi:anti-sigma regulatory factor (Ser/Thr protein kinase)